MIRGSHLFLLVTMVQILVVTGSTDSSDFGALRALRVGLKNVPPSWRNRIDPCSNWDGISCDNGRVNSIKLAGFNLTGQLTSDIGRLSDLVILDLSNNQGLTGLLPPAIGDLEKLSYLFLVACGFYGKIPNSIGSLQQLEYLSLNSNRFVGQIPPSIGNLSNLAWLDLADNRLTGTIPVSDGITPGLDLLLQAKHFHFGGNKLSGEIPSQLFSSDMNLVHLLLENNQLTGTIPSTLGLVPNLTIVRLDGNSLNGSVPENLSGLSSLEQLNLANNKFTGPLPNLDGMDSLSFVDMSNNSFDPTEVPTWFSSLDSLTTLNMENTQIQGELPDSLFSLIQLQQVILKNNKINGTLNFGSTYSTQLGLVDLQENLVEGFTDSTVDFKFTIILVDNPYCREHVREGLGYCTIPHRSNISNSFPAGNCSSLTCNSTMVFSLSCECAYPFVGTLVFRAPSFSSYGNSSVFESLRVKLMNAFLSLNLPVDSVVLSSPMKIDYLLVGLQVFPSGRESFSYAEISALGFFLNSQDFDPPPGFGPYYFNSSNYPLLILYPGGMGKNQSRGLSRSITIGAAVGGTVLFSLLLLAGVYAFRQKKRAETATRQSNPFASWDPNRSSGGVPQLKGIKCFSFDELKKCTDNFSDFNSIGSGGYGKVYRGILHGQTVAIKRAQQGSMQGGLEFKTEIELLSRVHHKNVVSLVGFCFDEGEQMLVYEFVANGILKDSLSGRSGIRLDWMRRLRIAIGAARGIQYLHDLANPPIIHRDIKSNNILLDERLNAKVADFGLSKPMSESNRGHVTTQVKGTMGYLDPEYYMTQQLTEKSDVYSFGVLLLELLTSRTPIEKGKYIVREVKVAMDRTKAMYNLHKIIDPIIGSNALPRSVEMFVDLALRCVEESGVDRPPMSEVVKEIESIMELIGLNPNAESASTSTSYENASKGSHHPYSNENLMAYSGAFLPTNLEIRTQGDLYGSTGHL